jgi:tetratricopeptide (TPR) repeat protein
MKKPSFLLCLLYLTITGQSQSAGEYLTTGNKKYSVNDYSGAIAAYSKAIEEDPGYAEAFYRRSLSNMEMQHYGKAILDLNKVLEIKPNYAEAYTFRGIARIYILGAFRLNDTYVYNNELVTDLNFATIAHTDWKYMLPQDKISEFTQKDPTGMLLLEYLASEKINPGDSKAYFYRGLAKSKLNDCAGSITDIILAMQGEPRYMDSVSICTTPEGYVQAIADFTKAIEIDPEYMDAYYWRGFANVKSGIETGCDDLVKAESLGDNRASGLLRKYCE